MLPQLLHKNADMTAPAILTRLTQDIERQGYTVMPDLFTPSTLEQLAAHYRHLDSEDFHLAGIGRESDHEINRRVRADKTCWLEPGPLELFDYFATIEHLRQHFNRQFFLGLREFECHFACYPPGAFYRTHLDAFRGKPSRKISLIVYLNRAWQPSDGGELILYPDNSDSESCAWRTDPLLTVEPRWGTTVLFLSEDFPHEVRPTNATRLSLTGWFRI